MAEKTYSLIDSEGTQTVGKESALSCRCDICGKVFETERAMKGHLGGAHKRRGKKK